eukprot:SAG31_NODE_529_length_14420_cov_20.000140_3_plen_77_part_00
MMAADDFNGRPCRHRPMVLEERRRLCENARVNLGHMRIGNPDVLPGLCYLADDSLGLGIISTCKRTATVMADAPAS